MGEVSRMRLTAAVLIGLAALTSLANGFFMLIDPLGWYAAVPTVSATGPANSHFLRDIGLAYLTCAMLFGYALVSLGSRLTFAVAANLWLTFHGLLHVYEVSSGICAPGIFWQDAPVVLGPPIIVWFGIWLAHRV